MYSDGIDEWVCGMRCICGMCEDEHAAAVAELRDLETEGGERAGDEDDIAVAKAAVKAIRKSYRSYNHVSMKLYAQRYAWYAPANN